MPAPRVVIPCDVKRIGTLAFHAVGEKYIDAVAHGAGCLPLLLPAFGAGAELEPLDAVLSLDDVLDAADGLFLTGSHSNIAPEAYGHVTEGEPQQLDLQRDTTAIPLLRAAIERGLPTLAACRGFQELNVAFGGTLHQRVHEVEGYRDHRERPDAAQDVAYGHAHPVTVAPDGLLHEIVGVDELEVNSLHGQGIRDLAERLVVEARADDGLVEAVSFRDAPGFALGVQWHPEWRFREDEPNRRLLAAFGDAVRRYQQVR